MTTISFTVFLILGFLLTLIIKPSNKIQAWLYSIFIPIGFLLVTVAIFGKGDAYTMGRIIAGCSIATISTFILMVILLIRKVNRSKDD